MPPQGLSLVAVRDVLQVRGFTISYPSVANILARQPQAGVRVL